MSIEEYTKVTCDLCGKRIDGDFLELELGLEVYQFHPQRVAALIPCGNLVVTGVEDLIEKLKKTVRRK